MSPCPWRNDPGTTTGGHRLSSHPLRRWPRQRSLGELTGGQRWGALQLGGLGRAPPAPPCPPHADGGDEPRSAPRQGGESYRPLPEPEMRFSSPRWALCLSASLKCRLKSECII